MVDTEVCTPQKAINIDCFVCLGKGIRNYKLSGTKLLKDNFKQSVCELLQEDLYCQLLELDGGVCRNCHSKILKTYDFLILLKNSTESFISSSSVKRKRGILSPITPKQIPASVIRSNKHPRKQLCLGQKENESETIGRIELQNKHKLQTEQFENLDHSYSMPKVDCVSDDDKEILDLLNGVFSDITSQSDSGIYQLHLQSNTLTSRTAMFSSVLSKYRPHIVEHGSTLFRDIIIEMKERVPLLLETMCAVAVPFSHNIQPTLIPAIAASYSILMKQKYNNLSAFHRLTSAIAVRGGLDEQGQTRLNHMGLMLSSQRRLAFQESIRETTEKKIINNLKVNPLCKITGDNLDVYVKTTFLSSERRNKDLHMFASNIIFSRIANIDMCNDPPNVDLNVLDFDSVMQTPLQKERMKSTYVILLGRIMCKMPFFRQFKKLIPDHITHEYIQKMAMASKVLPLEIQFKNEANHADCLAIMDSYEHLLKRAFEEAFGSDQLLEEYKVVLGGDQLTRVRLQEAKNLRTLSRTREKRLEDLHPIVCELWHSKQDLLEKCFKQFYSGKSQCAKGTLSYFKALLHRTNVNGKVKGRFQPHFQLLMDVGEGMVTEQLMEFFKMESSSSVPHHMLQNIKINPPCEQKQKLYEAIEAFIDHYGYCSVDNPDNTPADHDREDSVYNYCLQLCHWYIHLLHMHDTAKEGDLNRALLNCKYSLPFFYSHSKLSKYLVENIDYVLKCEHTLSPLQRLRVLEGSFINIHGGAGKNVESDLVQEHSVCNQKNLIKSLGANKSEKSITRVTRSADAISELCSAFDECIHLKQKSGRHAKATLSEGDQKKIYDNLRKLRPFEYSPGRQCKGFEKITSVPVPACNMQKLRTRVKEIIDRLTRGLHSSIEHGDDDDDVDTENEILDNLPNIAV